MNNYNEKEEKKGGFGSALSGLFRGGSSVAGSASSGMGSAGGGLAGLFATKAGIVGMVLGGATIAAGVGVIYNFIGPSSKPVYSPELFQSSYYEEEASKAGLERTNSRDASAAASSTLDMFKEQAKKKAWGWEGKAAKVPTPTLHRTLRPLPRTLPRILRRRLRALKAARPAAAVCPRCRLLPASEARAAAPAGEAAALLFPGCRPAAGSAAA